MINDYLKIWKQLMFWTFKIIFNRKYKTIQKIQFCVTLNQYVRNSIHIIIHNIFDFNNILVTLIY